MRIDRTARVALVAFTVAVGSMAISPAASIARPGYISRATSEFGGSGAGDGEFSEPAGVAVAEATGDVYVADTGNDRVQEFDAQGKYLGQFDGSEAPTGQFSGPYSVAVDNSSGPDAGDVYVTDVGHNVVDMFNAAGKYLSQLAGASGTFEQLLSVVVDTTGNVWVFGLKNSDGYFEEFSDTGVRLVQFDTRRSKEPGFAVDSKNGIYLLFGGGSIGKYHLTGPEESAEKLEEWDGGVHSLVLDPATNDLFADRGSAIEEYGPYGEPFGAPVETFGTESLTNSLGVAVNAGNGTVYATDQATNAVDIFKTLVFPDVSTGPASGVERATASVAGSVKRDGLATKYFFQYGYGEGTPDITTPVIAVGGEEEALSVELTGLDLATTYHYRLVAENENGTSYGQELTFTTLPAAATVNDQPPTVSGITRTSALVIGTVDTEHSATTVHIEYVDAGEYESDAANPYKNGASSQIVELEAMRGGRPVGPVPLPGLLAGTVYHYRLVASNPAGTTYGPDYTFTTAPATPPTVSTGAASETTQTGVLLSGTVDPRELQTSYEFEVGTDTSYGGAKLFGNAGRNGVEAVTASLQYLIPGTTYHYRLVATNEDGSSYGQDMTFTTPAVSASIAQPATLAFVASPAVVFPSVAGAITKAQGSGKQAKKKAKTRHKHRAKPKRGGRKISTGRHDSRRGGAKR